MEYVLDASKWICGYGGEYALLGERRLETAMLNDEGFMCCLGQFASHRLEELGEDVELNMIDTQEPEDVAKRAGSVYDSLFVIADEDDEDDEDDDVSFDNTALAVTLMNINDEMDTTPREKVAKIRNELEKHGHTLKVINEEHLDDWKKRSE